MPVYQLLELMADGEFHSGEELGYLLGVSRTAVWKQLQKLDELGLELESLKGKGYRLVGGFNGLNVEQVQAGLNNEVKHLLGELDFRGIVDSTSAVAAERLRRGSASGYLCAAEFQQSGRGRLGRRWVSPYGRNIMASLVWEFEGGAAALEGLSLVVGLSIAAALDEMGIAGVQLKWPNDVQIAGHKIAGILLEMYGDAAGPCQVVIGIGLNVAMPESADIDQLWTDLRSRGAGHLDRNRVLAGLLNSLLPSLSTFAERGFGHFVSQWSRFDALQGQPVEIIRGDLRIEGLCRGVAENGALLFEREGVIEQIIGGEVSLRRRA